MNAIRPPSPRAVQDAFTDLAATAQRLLTDYPDMAIEDQQLWQDMLEGCAQGDPFAVLDRLVNAAVQNEHFAEAVRSRRTELAERLDRFTKNAERQRAMVQRMLEHLAITKLARPDYSLSVGMSPPKVLVSDVDALPAQYTRVTVEPNKTAIAAAMKLGDEVPGASWSNGTPTLSIRVR